MSGRRRSRHRVRRRATPFTPAVSLAAVGLLLASVGTGAYFVLSGLGSGCHGDTTVRIVADPGPARALTTIATAYNQGHPAVGGTCANVAVASLDSREALTALSKGGSASSAGPAPDVWVPDSTDWLEMGRADPTAARQLPKTAPSIATTALVVGMPKPKAAAYSASQKTLTWEQIQDSETAPAFWAEFQHPEWGGFGLEFADPVSSDASLQAVLDIASVRRHVAPSALTVDSFHTDRIVQLGVLAMERASAGVLTTDQALFDTLRRASASGRALTGPSAFPMFESDLIAYNTGMAGGGVPSTPLAALYPDSPAGRIDIPYVPLAASSADAAKGRVIADFLTRLQRPDMAKVFQDDGFRGLDGAGTVTGPATGTRAGTLAARPAGVSGPALTSATSFFTNIHGRCACLALVDISGSMKEPVPGTNPRASKADVAANALITALPLFAPDSEAGLWVFATHLDNGKDYKEIFPVEPMDSPGRDGKTHRDDLRELRQYFQPTGDTALYESTLAAFRDRAAHFVAGKLNKIILLTDGRNDTPDNPNGITLDQLLTALRQEYNPQKPVQIITIAYGADADPGPLRQIASATGALSYQSRNPTDIFNVFVDALTQGS